MWRQASTPPHAPLGRRSGTHRRRQGERVESRITPRAAHSEEEAQQGSDNRKQLELAAMALASSRRKVPIYHGKKTVLKGYFSWLINFYPRFAYRGLSTVTVLSAMGFQNHGGRVSSATKICTDVDMIRSTIKMLMSSKLARDNRRLMGCHTVMFSTMAVNL
jgi:hypothetical protein